MLEALGECLDVLVGKESDKIGGLRRITPHNLNGGSSLEDPRNLVARHEERDPSGWDPLRKLPLSVGV
jgi:hypothetical protein